MAGFETKDEVAKAMLLIVHLLTSKILRLSNCKNLGFVTCVNRTVWCVHSSCCTRTKQAMDLLMILSTFFFFQKVGSPAYTYATGWNCCWTVSCSAQVPWQGRQGTSAECSSLVFACVRACVRACISPFASGQLRILYDCSSY